MERNWKRLKPHLGLLGVLFAVCLGLAALYWARQMALTADGVPLDDAWIYFQFARMGAQGRLGEFNAGEPVTGITGPLWALVLIPLHALAGEHLNLFLVLVKGLGIFLYCAGVGAMYALGHAIFRSRQAGLAAGLFLALMPKNIWGALSGMESPLLVFLLLVALNLMVRCRSAGWGRDFWAPLVIGLAGQTRPEANLLYVIFVVYQVLFWLRDGRPVSARRLIGDLLKQAGVFVLVMAPNVVYTYVLTGHPLANTFYAKTRGFNWAASLRFFAFGNLMLWTDPPATATFSQMAVWPPRSAGLAVMLTYAGLKAILVLALFGWGVRSAICSNEQDARHGALSSSFLAVLPALAWLAGDFLLYTIFFTRANRHYFVPMLPPIALLCGGGLAALLQRPRPGRYVAPALGIVFAFFAVGAIDWANEYAWNVKNINDQQVAIGRWVDMNLPADAVLAINDVGAIKYFSQRRIVDVTGLLTPALLPYSRTGRKMEYLRQVAPDYLIVYDSWFPEAAQWEGFQPIAEFRLHFNTIAGGDTVRIYQVLSFPPAEGG